MTQKELYIVIETCRPYHDELVRGLALDLLEAQERIVELEDKIRALSDENLRAAQTSGAINLSWILNLDKLAKRE